MNSSTVDLSGPDASRFQVTQAFPDAARPASRDLPSLDGLRALSIGFVLIGHWSQGHDIPDVRLIHLADFGVLVFFVISGYLITTLLCREGQKRGEINLRRFYLRRTLRIFPPYYFYLAAIALGAATGGMTIPSDTRWWSALAYVTNFIGTNNPLMRHTWSLSLEEQFYVTWPLVLALWIRNSNATTASRISSPKYLIALLAFPAFLRVLIFALTRNGGLTGQFIFDYFAAGSSLAILESSKGWERGRSALECAVRSSFTPLAGVLALALHFGFTGNIRWAFAANMLLITPAKAMLLALFVVWTVRNPRHSLGRLLNWRPLRVIGIGSYSLYLWQQMFFAPGASFAVAWSVPTKLAAAATCAAISYFIVERPSLHLRAQIEQRQFARAP